jgi:hypothetical protein
MCKVFHIPTTVLPGNGGGRIEVTAPELMPGECVDVVILVQSDQSADAAGIVQLLESLPPGPRPADSWETLERLLREVRDSW